MNRTLPINQLRGDTGEEQHPILRGQLQTSKVHHLRSAAKRHPVHTIPPYQFALRTPYPFKARSLSLLEQAGHPLVRDNLHHLILPLFQERAWNHSPFQAVTLPTGHPLLLLLPLKSQLPIPIRRGQTKSPVQSHVVDDDAAHFPLLPSQSPPHHLQVLRQRKRRPCNLDKLHVGTIKPLSKQVHTHQHTHPLQLPSRYLEPFNQLLPPLHSSLRTDSLRLHPLLPVVGRNMLRMHNINRIHNPLLARSMPLISRKQSLNTRRIIQLLPHLLRLEIPIRTPFHQPINPLLVLTIRPHRIVIIRTKPSLSNKSLDAIRLYQHLKQVGEPLTTHAPRRGRQSQELRLWPGLPHHLIRFGQRMMRLIHYHKAYPLLPQRSMLQSASYRLY